MKKLICIFIPCVLISLCLVLHITQVRAPAEGSGANAEEASEDSGTEPVYRPYAYLFELAPDLEGLIKKIDTGEDGPRLFYTADKDNPYSLPAGAYAGELMTGIELNEREACAVALVPEAACSIKNKHNAGENKLIIPLNIKGGENFPLRISTVTRSSNNLSCLLVSFGGNMELINTLLSASGFVLSSNSMNISLTRNGTPLTLENYRILVPELREDMEEGLFAVYISNDFQCAEEEAAGLEFGSLFNISVPSPVLISSPMQAITEENLLRLRSNSGAEVLVLITAATEK